MAALTTSPIHSRLAVTPRFVRLCKRPHNSAVCGRMLRAVIITGLVSLAVQSDEQLIRAARERSNAAIAKHDLDGIAAAWLDDVHVVSSTSAQTAGKSVNRERMA